MVASPVIASRPHLWAADLGAVISLAGRLATGDLFNLPETLEFGQHIILVDKDTPEIAVRQGIYQILASGNSPEVYEAQQPIAILAAHESLSAGELSAHIVGTSQTWEKWLEKRSHQEDLSFKNAVEIAKVVWAFEQEPQRSVELGTLRKRCGESSYDWNNLIRKLEKQIASKNNLIGSVTGDSAISGDTSNPCGTRFTATVTTVTEILDLGFTDYEEQQLLEDIWEQSGLSKGSFWKLVNSQKNKIDTLQPEDEIKLNNLINWHNAKLDFKKALPSMAVDFEHDAQILGIEPIVLWQPFLASVMSLVGKKINLDVESHTIPAIAWTMTVLKSGGGKTRADNLILAPIKKLQSLARRKFLAEMKEFENPSKKSGEGEEKPTRPIEQKYLFEVATIQAVMRRASEQPGKRGQLWTRDEISGLFKSLGQFGSGENEGKECLLKMWDGSPMQVDRVRQEDSFFIDETRISVNGGIQPGHYRNVFNDPNDSQGLTARFLTANSQPLKPKRVKGYCDLSAKLPPLYDWLINLPEAVIKLSSAADSYYDKLYDEIGGQAHTTSQPAIQAWMYKLPANLLRIALALHFIECYHDQNRDFSQIQKDTLERAVLFAQYYRSAFHIIQETTTDNDDISSILLKIWDASATKHPDGITTRDAYRNIKAIQYRARDMGRDVSAYTAELFGMLEAKGKGRVIKNGRTIKFIAKIGGTDPDVPDPNIKPDISPGSLQEEVAIIHSKSENPNIGDRVTVPEKTAVHDLEVSPPNLVSPVTVANHSESTGQIEITRKPDAHSKIQNEPVSSGTSYDENTEIEGDRIAIEDQTVTTPQPIITTNKETTQSVFKVGQKVEFLSESDHQWHKGKIESIDFDSGYFVKAAIKYWAFGKSRSETTYREDWLKNCESIPRPDGKSDNSKLANLQPPADKSGGYTHRWKKGDRANYRGKVVSIYSFNCKDGSIMVGCEDAELLDAEICELFRLE